MKSKPLQYPPWVNKGHLIIGDVRYIKEDGVWKKYLYSGRLWISESIAPTSLKNLSNKRRNYLTHVKLVRKTGI